MISGLKPYPDTKDSGVPWLGAIPSHWGAVSSRRVFSARKELARPDDVQLSATQAYGVIPQAEFEARERRRVVKISMHLEKRRHVERDDFVISMRSFQGGLERAWASGCIRSSYVVLKAERDVDVDYFSYLFKSKQYIGALQAMAGFIRDGQDLNYGDFCSVPLPDVPFSEQRSIAQFLGYIDRRIRRYIRIKQNLTKLLEEQESVIIHRAVTRGLDAGVRLKDSGAEWLGLVPVHWSVSALRHRYDQALGKMLDAKRIEGTDLLPYLRNTDVQWDRINVSGLPAMDILAGEYERYTVQPGDLLVCEGGEIGRCAIWHGGLERCGFQKALHRLRPLNSERDLPRFLLYSLRAATSRSAFSDGHVSTIAHLTGDKLRAHSFAFPPAGEQSAIVRALDRELQDVHRIAVAATKQIELLREYRARLVSDVVTGQLDVRAAASRLPQDVGDPGLVDAAEPEDGSGFGEETLAAAPDEVEL